VSERLRRPAGVEFAEQGREVLRGGYLAPLQTADEFLFILTADAQPLPQVAHLGGVMGGGRREEEVPHLVAG
jgi:hypothetical protein